MPVVPLRSLPEESSQFRHLTTLATTPCFLPLVRASLFVGLGDAVGGSYLTLFMIDKAHLSPLALGVFLTVYSLSGMIISTSFGRWFDRTPSPIPLLLAPRCLLFVGRRCCETLLPFIFEWQRIIATTFLASSRCISQGIGPRRFCRATPPTIPDRQAVPARWSPLLVSIAGKS